MQDEKLNRDRQLNKDPGQEPVAERESGTQTETSLHTVFTSGSTGTPFKVVQDANKRNRTVADLTYAHDHIGWHLGDKYIFIRNWVSNYKQSRVKSIAQNVHNVNITGFNDEEKRKLCDYLKKHHNAIIFGYASAVYEFACFVERSSFQGRILQSN